MLRNKISRTTQRLINDFQTRKREIFLILNPTPKSQFSSGQNLLVFSSNRTGSTLLGTLLNSHPEINHMGEIFLRFSKCYYKKVHFPHTYIRGMINADSKYNSFEIKTQHMSKVFFNKDLDLVKKLYKRNWKIVYLRRVNILRQALSHYIAMETGQWHNFPEKNFRFKKVQIDNNKLLDLINWFMDLRKIEEEKLQGIDYLQITYEDDLLEADKHQETCNKIFDYAGIHRLPVSSAIKRISTAELSDQITNFEEVEDFFFKTEYADFL